MQEIIYNKLFNTILLLTIIGEFLLPWILKHFYIGYDSKKMVMSVLGNPKSPVRFIYNFWLIWLGCFLTFTAIIYYHEYKDISFILSCMVLLSIIIFALGAGVLSGIYSVNEVKELSTTASKIHGLGAATGFMALLFFPLLNGILAFKQQDSILGTISIIAFILSFIFFVFFVMGDKEQFQDTILSYEGLWERLTLFCMYIPFLYNSIRAIRTFHAL